MAIHLGRPSPSASRDRPGRWRGNAPGPRRADRPYLVLLRVGFTPPPPLPEARCALTAPFHPCRAAPEGVWRGGLLSVALSLGSPPPGVTRHPISVEPGLSSPRIAPQGRRAAAIRPSGSLELGASAHPVNKPDAFQARVSSQRASRAARRAAVSRSARPSTRSGRKWRWKARISLSKATASPAS